MDDDGGWNWVEEGGEYHDVDDDENYDDDVEISKRIFPHTSPEHLSVLSWWVLLGRA